MPTRAISFPRSSHPGPIEADRRPPCHEVTFHTPRSFDHGLIEADVRPLEGDGISANQILPVTATHFAVEFAEAIANFLKFPLYRTIRMQKTWRERQLISMMFATMAGLGAIVTTGLLLAIRATASLIRR